MSQLPDFSEHGYRAVEVLGTNPEGGRTAYRGVRLSDDQAVVIKRFSFASGDASWESYASHERELQMLAGLKHPRIPAYLGDFQTDDGFCMVQEFCTAPAMSSRRHWKPKQVKRLAESALELLVFLQDHTPPVVHRDIKPDNILVDQDGNAFLVDFGLARADRAQATTIAVGTPGFMPPEQLLGHELTTATDLYGLGAALMSALTGTPSANIGSLVDSTFSFDLGRLPKNLSPAFRDWIGDMVAPGLKERFGSAQEALNALRRVASVTGRPKPPSKPRHEQRPQAQTKPRATPKKKTPPKASPSRKRHGSKRGKNQGPVWLGVAIAAAMGGYMAIDLGAGTNGASSNTRAESQGITCNGTMTITESLTMKQQRSPIRVLEGCDVTVQNATFKGVVGLQVKARAKVRLDNVTIETKHPTVELAHPDAEVTIVNSTLKGQGYRAVMLRKGKLTIDNSTLSASRITLDANGGEFTVKDSTISGSELAIAVYNSKGTVTNATMSGGGRRGAVMVRTKSALTLNGGSIKGGVFADESSTLSGLDSVKLDLGADAGKTWAETVCRPVLKCIKGSGVLGEFVADLRVPLNADGSAGVPEFLQKKLDPKQEKCISERLEAVKVPGPDGKPHAVRCTTNGNVMAGGGGMTSVDFKLEK